MGPMPRVRQLVLGAIPVGLTVAVLLATLILAVQAIGEDPGRIGQDYRFYRDVGQRWIDSGTFYLDRQLSGEYELALMVDVLYPPTALAIFVPLAVLPPVIDAAVWWSIPFLVLSRQIWIDRPAPWTWPIAAVLLFWPRSYGSILWGNTDMWMLAAVSGGLQWGWPALIAILKPSFAPLALVGIRHRSWWIGAAVLAVLAVATIPLWLDYVRALTSVRGLGLDYSLFNLPLALIPLVLHAGRRTARTGTPASATPEPAKGFDQPVAEAPADRGLARSKPGRADRSRIPVTSTPPSTTRKPTG
jgi:hypothetical protein